MSDSSTVYHTSISIPFPSSREAEIVYDVLRLDQEPKKSGVIKSLQLEGNHLHISIDGEEPKKVRVALTGFFDALTLACETILVFGPPTSKKYDHYYS